ncbi:MAG: tRNA lysidine(34) synthetase TilS [Fervidobacterium sp.]|uniref:tRNA lysidine(34) synthetase TilS n=1 Tax=Fervidobacterium sp. TaxID=1871331 RepID=UPI00404A8C35
MSDSHFSDKPFGETDIDLLQRFEETIEKYVPNTGSFLLAVSGGVDSVVMFDLFVRLKDKKELRIGVATFNHKLREEADREVEFVKNLSESYNIPFYTDSADVKAHAHDRGLSIEEAARILRYEFLHFIKDRYNYDVIVTAHNMNDLLETMILRFAKGTGPFGMAGIKPVSGEHFRPLLFFTREEIENYAQARNLVFFTDVSNFDERYERNYVRHRIVPLLRKLNPSIERAAESLAQSTWKLDEYIQNAVDKTKKFRADGCLFFKLSEDKYIQTEQIRRFALEFFGRPLDREKIERFENAKSKSFKVSFWGNLGIEVSHGWVMMGDIIKQERFEYTLTIEKHGNKIIFCPNEREYYINGYFIDFANRDIMLSEGVEKIVFKVRNWIEGDRTFEGKKVKEIFNEKKVPTFLRRMIPLIEYKRKIVLIPHIYKSRVLDELNLHVVVKGGFGIES